MARTPISFSVAHFDRLPDTARIDVHDLVALSGTSRATIYRLIARGTLPRPCKLGGDGSKNSWPASEVRAFLAGRGA